MPVAVVPHDPAWAELFAQEAAVLRPALGPWLAGDVEHIGSTAVPGLDAKPILDMLAPVADLAGARDALPVLHDLGYRPGTHRADEALWLSKGDDRARTHQLHLTQPDSALWRERLTFRDALRRDPALRADYAQLKHRLAAQVDDVATYTAGKRAFVARVLADAGIDLD